MLEKGEKRASAGKEKERGKERYPISPISYRCFRFFFCCHCFGVYVGSVLFARLINRGMG